LYRAASIPARYVYGTIEIPIEKAMNWVGVQNPYTCASVFASGGIPSKAITSGGKIVAIRLEHCWVEAYVTYDQYRGARQSVSHKIWVALDPSLKQYEYTEGIDLSTEIPFDAESFLNELIGSATINEEKGYFININTNLIETRMEEYQNQIEEYINTNMPTVTVGNVLGERCIKKKEYGILPSGLPCETLLIQNRYSEIPDSVRHKTTFELPGKWMEPGINYTASTPELAGKRITLSYVPATSEDETVIKSYIPKPHSDGSPITLSEFPTTLPAYLINLKPELKIEGEIKATGGEIKMGENQEFTLKFFMPPGLTDKVFHNLKAGGFYAIGLDIGGVSKEMLQKRVDKISATKEFLEKNQISSVTKDDLLGEFLYTMGISYFSEVDAINSIAAKSLKIINIRMPSEGMAFFDLSVTYLFSFPISAKASGIKLDVARNVDFARSSEGDTTKEKQYVVSSGIISSILEHSIFEQVFGGEAISAVKILEIANNAKIPIYSIDKSNIEKVLPDLSVDVDVIADIQNAVNAGCVVTIPKQEISFEGWTGTGYIIIDPETGDGSYLISGGMAGGFKNLTTIEKAEFILLTTALLALMVATTLVAWEVIAIGVVLDEALLPYLAAISLFFDKLAARIPWLFTSEGCILGVQLAGYKIMLHSWHHGKGIHLVIETLVSGKWIKIFEKVILH
ncbi:MAG: hypothetical protein AB1567_06280, partial [bacterium]